MPSLLLHSVSYAGFWGQPYLDVEAFLAKASELGFDGVMLAAKRPHASPLDYDAAARAKLRSRLDHYNLKDLVLAGYCNLTADLDHSDIPTKEINLAYLTELARLAHDLGGSVLRVFTGYEHPAQDYGRQMKLVTETLKEASRRAAGFGVILGVQNHHDLAVGHESMLDLIRNVAEPNCRALYDAWAPALHGEDLTLAAQRLAPLTIHTTVADYQKRPRYKYRPDLVNYEAQTPFIQAVPMGEGFIDYKAFFAALTTNGFKGSICYEMCSPLRDGSDMSTLDSYARRFLEYMQEHQRT
jgi:sugar phosphate isomerase/epimerase